MEVYRVRVVCYFAHAAEQFTSGTLPMARLIDGIRFDDSIFVRKMACPRAWGLA